MHQSFNPDPIMDKLQAAFIKVSHETTYSGVHTAIDEVKAIIIEVHNEAKLEGFNEGYKKGHEDGSKINIEL